MNPLVSALQKVVDFLEKHNVSYMIIGGLANSFYGNQRQTFDIDIKIDLDDRDVAAFINSLSEIGKPAPEDPLAFLKETSVIPFDVQGVRIDLIRGGLPFEKEAIQRSKKQHIFGLNARISTLEDLIIQKAVSTRDKDWIDIAELIRIQKVKLDWSYLLKHVREISDFVSEPEMLRRIEAFKNEK